jgi:hypothetical protein
MEKDMIKNWNYIKGIFSDDKPYLTEKELEKFEQKMKRAVREKKLKRILIGDGKITTKSGI